MNLRKLPRLAVALAVAVLVTTGCGSAGGHEVASGSRAQRPSLVRGVMVVAAGDIACPPGQAASRTRCQQAATARLAARFRPRYVIPLGDQQYENGQLSDYRSTYARTWGRFTRISRPVPGNHDYHVAGAAGYFAYFQQETTSPGYYAYNVGHWRVYALNSNCSAVDCGAEAAWLNQDMTANPRTCTALTMHHPRYSSSQHGDNPDVEPFWAVALRHHADLALAGHSHQYERFRAMDASGNATIRGMVSFIVGTGGKSLFTRTGPRKGSVVYDDHRAGVLTLNLGRRAYGWIYKTIDGKTVDSGRRTCH
jgi:hypothetical protein